MAYCYNRCLALFVVTFTLLLTGCATTATTDPSTYAPPSGMANIYIFRVTGMAESSLALVRLNGNNQGGLATNYYMKFTVAPGAYTVSTQLSNVAVTKINAQAGQAYYIMVTTQPAMGGATVQQNLVTDGSGPGGVANSILTK